MSSAHSGMTFELVHVVSSNDIRFPLIYRFERVYLVDMSRTIIDQKNNFFLSLGSLFFSSAQGEELLQGLSQSAESSE